MPEKEKTTEIVEETKTEYSGGVKLEQEELDAVKQLQQKYTDVILRIGQNSLQMNSVESTLDELKEKREALTQEHQLLQKNEQEVVKSLTDKYGNGNLDVDSGIFTPNK
jgi:hypothetical protein